MKIKIGDTVLCKHERKNSLTPLYDPDPMVVIGFKGSSTAKNSVRIRTRNYADWKLLKYGCRESPPCEDSDVELEGITIDRPCKSQSRAESGGDAAPPDWSRELPQGHEQPEANSDIGEYEAGRLATRTRLWHEAKTWILGSAQKENKIYEGHYLQRLYLRIVNICPFITLDVILTNIFIFCS